MSTPEIDRFDVESILLDLQIDAFHLGQPLWDVIELRVIFSNTGL